MQESQAKQKKINEALSYVKRIFKNKFYSENEIRRKLQAKGFSEVCDDVVQILKSYKMINDLKFAQLIASSTAEFKNYGPKRIRSLLVSKGYDESLVDDVLSKLDMDFVDSAKKVAFKFIKKHNFKDYFDKKRKIYNHLIYKGFNVETIEEALKEIKEENE